MKKCFFTLVILMSSLISYSQDYQPFPKSNAYWTYVENTGNWGSQLPASSSLVYSQFMLSGADTVLNGNTYKIVVKRAYLDSTYSANSPTPNYANKIANVPDEISLAIREDNKKIMGIRFPSTTEFVLYDFNKLVGDTVKFYHDYNSFLFGSVILAQDSVLIGSSYHKRWTIDNPSKYIVEGVGGMLGLYLMLNGQNDVNLSCFNNGSGTYSNSGASCFYIYPYGTPASVTGVKDDIGISVGPNPFTDKIRVKASNVVDVYVYNSIGQKVLSEMKVSTKEINTSTLPSGIYFVVLVNDDGVSKQVKLLK